MRKFHWFEFKNSRMQLAAYFLMLFFLIGSELTIEAILAGLQGKDNQYNLRSFVDFCESLPDDLSKMRQFWLFNCIGLLSDVFQLIAVFICINIVFVKSSHDVL